jgi:hypothetical protein
MFNLKQDGKQKPPIFQIIFASVFYRIGKYKIPVMMMEKLKIKELYSEI